MKKLQLEALVPGLILAEEVKDAKGQLVLAKSARLTVELILKLRNCGVEAVNVVESLPFQPHEEHEQSVTPSISAAHARVVQVTKNVLTAPEIKQIDPNLLDLMVGELVGQIDLSRNVLLNLSHLKTYDDYLFLHSVNVAMLALIIGREMKLEATELRDLGLAALLHDVGMTRISGKINLHNHVLAADEWPEVKRHPEYGYEMLQGAPTLSEAVILGVWEHHERLDGSGYPQGLTGEAIHLFARIVAVADVYDACISPRKYRRSFSPHEALKNLLGESHLFDIGVLKAFIISMAVYPIGTYVRLNTGEAGKVIGVNNGAPFRPEVRLLLDRQQQPLIPSVRISLAEEDFTHTYIEETLSHEEMEQVRKIIGE
jgi:HD-GYP domain-containing protein (c-di-GMP phosphodiesterase class II)